MGLQTFSESTGSYTTTEYRYEHLQTRESPYRHHGRPTTGSDSPHVWRRNGDTVSEESSRTPRSSTHTSVFGDLRHQWGQRVWRIVRNLVLRKFRKEPSKVLVRWSNGRGFFPYKIYFFFLLKTQRVGGMELLKDLPLSYRSTLDDTPILTFLSLD